MRPPRIIRLLSQRVTVRTVADIDISDRFGEGAAAYGVFDADGPNILLTRKQGPDRMRETFLHENLHLMFAHAKLCADEGGVSEEEAVNRLAPVMLSWVRENPSAVEYLRRKD